MKTIGILNGPNLNRLGKREPEIYGRETLTSLENRLTQKAVELGICVECFQSNHEGALIDQLVAWEDAGVRAVVFNPGALTHTSVALHDAIAGSALQVIEVHISNIYQREAFRHHSMTASACQAVLSGLGLEGYLIALEYLAKQTQ